MSGGCKQRKYTSTEGVYHPTSHIEPIREIDTTENRVLAVVGIPYAFVQTGMIKEYKPATIIIVFKEEHADMLCEISSKVYVSFVVKDVKESTFIDVLLLKDLYDIMKPILMVYQSMLNDLASKSLDINKYNPSP